MQQQAMMAGVYFKANEEIKVLDEFEGQKGQYLETFAINDKRNKNGWKALWEGTKKNINTFRGKPGIEFVKCQSDGCDLDHTEAQSEELSLKVQEPYRVSTIVGFRIDEKTHTAYFVHKVHDSEFFERADKGEIKFVSPSIWPKAGGYEVIGHREDGTPLIDVWEWAGLHDAFVNKPAFGDDAKITAVCEGDKCPMKLLSAKEKTAISAVDAVQNCVSKKIENHYTDGQTPTKEKIAIFFSECREQLSAIVDQGDISHLQEVPLLVNHNKKKQFLTVSKSVYAKVSKILEDGGGVDESSLLKIIREDVGDNSFKTCTCSGSQMPEISEKEHEELKSKFAAMEEEKKELQSKLAAQDKTDEEQHKARVAKYVASFKAMNDDKKEDFKASIKAMEDEKEMKAMDEAEKEVKTAKNGQEDKKEEEQNAKIAALESKLSEPLIEKMAQARTLKGASEDEIKAFKASYENKSLSAVEADYNKERIFIEGELAANEANNPEEKIHIPFQGSEGVTQLSGKSLDEIFAEVN